MAHHSIEEAFKAIQPKRRKGIPDAPTIGVGVSSNNTDLSTSLSQAGQQIAQLQSTYQQQAALITANTEAVQGNTSAQGARSALSTVGSVASGLLGGFGLLSPLISGIASLFGGSSTPAALPIYTPPSPVAISASLNSAAPNATTIGSGTVSPGQPVSPNTVTAASGTANPAQPPSPNAVTAASGTANPGIASLFGGNSIPATLPAYTPPSPLAINATLNSATPSPATAGSGTVSPGQAVSPGQSAASSSQAVPGPQITVNVSAMDSQSFMDRSNDIANAVREAMLNMHPINGVVASL